MSSRALKDCTNAQDKIDEITLALNHDDGKRYIYIFVEGTYDCRIYEKFFNPTTAKIEFVGGGKSQVIIVLERLSYTGHVIGICDADFRHLDHNYPAIPELFFTDQHDIEMTMISFDDVLINALIEYRLQAQMISIRQNAMQEAEYIGYIRWFNEKNVCEIIFDGLGLSHLTSSTNGITVSMNNINLLVELNRRKRNPTVVLTNQIISNFISANTITEHLLLCNGHDVVKILTSIINLSFTPKIKHEDFAKSLRHSFLLSHFKQTKMYSAISTWQSIKGVNILN
ncbi:MAG: DUF4435 domain-containing protein [Bacteroidales bacterium]|jgi:hypothetical protein|nr:DUF4435 domain-containing protein [Bacteroidales bacterium]